MMNYKNKYLKYFEKNKQMGGSVHDELYYALIECNNPAAPCNTGLLYKLGERGADIFEKRILTGNIVLYDVLQELHNRGNPLTAGMFNALAIPLSAYLRPENRSLIVQKINQRSSEYTVPILSLAVAIGDDELVRELIKWGADIDATYKPDNKTPLMQAVHQNDVHSCYILVKAGARKDLRDSDGKTAFAIATRLAAQNPAFNNLLQHLQ